jgi:hypothetical protein
MKRTDISRKSFSPHALLGGGETMWKRLTLTALLLNLVLFMGLSLAAKLPSGGGKPKPPPVPSGPGLIALNDSGTITVMNPDGSGRTPVAVGVSGAVDPVWSPMFSDGTVKLAFHHYDSTTRLYSLMVVNVFSWDETNNRFFLDIGVPAPVSDARAGGIFQVDHGIYQMDWSPAVPSSDGKDSVKVCFVTIQYLGESSSEFTEVLEVVDLIYDAASGTFTADPTRAPQVLDAGGSPLYYNGSYWWPLYWWARFSPDGQWLAVQRNDPVLIRQVLYNWPSIWLAGIDADGTVGTPFALDKLGDFPNPYPAWSPDGSRLAFMSSRNSRYDIYDIYDIYVASLTYPSSGMPVVGSIKRVTNSSTNEKWLTWSPDGQQIVYSGQQSGYGGIGKVLVTTGKQFSLGGGTYPDWSPMDLPRLP